MMLDLVMVSGRAVARHIVDALKCVVTHLSYSYATESTTRGEVLIGVGMSYI